MPCPQYWLSSKDTEMSQMASIPQGICFLTVWSIRWEGVPTTVGIPRRKGANLVPSGKTWVENFLEKMTQGLYRERGGGVDLETRRQGLAFQSGRATAANTWSPESSWCVEWRTWMPYSGTFLFKFVQLKSEQLFMLLMADLPPSRDLHPPLR